MRGCSHDIAMHGVKALSALGRALWFILVLSPLVGPAMAADGGAGLNATTVSVSAPGPQEVVWTNPVGVSVSGGNVAKTAGTPAWDAGAVSTTAIVGDGYVEFTAAETDTQRALGLSYGDTNQPMEQLDFAFQLRPGGMWQIVEDGATPCLLGAYVPGLRFRIDVTGGVVTYRCNGSVVYTSPRAPSLPLRAHASLHTPGATLSNTVIAGELTENRPPVADAGGPYTAPPGKHVFFDASLSADPDGSAVSYTWSFGDGAGATGVRASHSYTAPGEYAVSLTVTDTLGATSTTGTLAIVPLIGGSGGDDGGNDPILCCSEGQTAPHAECLENQCVEVVDCGVSDCRECGDGGSGDDPSPCNLVDEFNCLAADGQWNRFDCTCAKPCNPGPKRLKDTDVVVTHTCSLVECAKATEFEFKTYHWAQYCQDGSVHREWTTEEVGPSTIVDDPTCQDGCNPCDPGGSKKVDCNSRQGQWHPEDCTCSVSCDPDGSKRADCDAHGGQWHPEDCTCPASCDPDGSLERACRLEYRVWDRDNCLCSNPDPPACHPWDESECLWKNGNWDPQTCTCRGGCTPGPVYEHERPGSRDRICYPELDLMLLCESVVRVYTQYCEEGPIYRQWSVETGSCIEIRGSECL